MIYSTKKGNVLNEATWSKDDLFMAQRTNPGGSLSQEETPSSSLKSPEDYMSSVMSPLDVNTV